MSLARQITRVAGQPASIRVGTVMSVSPLEVQVQDTVYSSESLGVLGSYFPVMGDTVAVIGQSNDESSDPASWLVMGKPSQDTYAIQAGEVTVSFGPATSFTQLITFVRPFQGHPAVTVNIASGAGATAGWIARATTVNATDFTLFLSGTLATFVNIPVQWIAAPLNQ